jgi:hypothetical protein
MSEHDLSEWVASIAEIFDELDVRWSLIGALAANMYRADPRFTTDVDALADRHPRMLERLEEAGYEVTVMATEGELPHLLRCHRGAENIDVLLPTVEYQVEALRRAEDHRLTVEDVIIHKLIAWRPRDRDDIRSILSTGPMLDGPYLDHWTAEWELGERWTQAQLDR